MKISAIPCPLCQSRVRAKKTRPMSALMTEITYMCQNPDCGIVFVASLEVSRALTLPSSPNTDMPIKLSQHVRRCKTSPLTIASA